MPSALDTLRQIYAISAELGNWPDIDEDLAAEAGLDESYARLLNAARLLDEDARMPGAVVQCGLCDAPVSTKRSHWRLEYQHGPAIVICDPCQRTRHLWGGVTPCERRPGA